MNDDMQLCLIWSHQHQGWWKPAGWGYTTSLFEAGRFSEQAAANALRWDLFREWNGDTPHEVMIVAPTLEQMRDVNVLLLVKERVEQATAEARANRIAGHPAGRTR
jgi:hypothetical protein